jgi:AcrR family transcriptional regulator
MKRSYRMSKRAEEQHRTRERILQATMQVHDEQGVAPTTMADVAKRAGVGQATLYRHFPSTNELVQACGGHVWAEMNPPTPDGAASVFAGLDGRRERLARLIAELDAFYTRGKLRLALASRDRELVPPLHGFLSAVEAGIDALVREALKPSGLPDRTIEIVTATVSFPVWLRFSQLDLPAEELRHLRLRLVECTVKAAEQ